HIITDIKKMNDKYYVGGISSNESKSVIWNVILDSAKAEEKINEYQDNEVFIQSIFDVNFNENEIIPVKDSNYLNAEVLLEVKEFVKERIFKERLRSISGEEASILAPFKEKLTQEEEDWIIEMKMLDIQSQSFDSQKVFEKFNSSTNPNIYHFLPSDLFDIFQQTDWESVKNNVEISIKLLRHVGVEVGFDWKKRTLVVNDISLNEYLAQCLIFMKHYNQKLQKK
ncbi:hypothetical protein, partial [Priestia megaterium]|uniref:hypothetical protein n=1 Tax=Priestia megaterium TaxID=1404 RepID=UPI003008CD4F